MTMYAALTVRKLKAGSYDEWRKAWEGDPEDMPEGGEVYIIRNLKDPDEIIAFGLIEGDIDAIKALVRRGQGAGTQGGHGSVYRVDRRRRHLRGDRAHRRQERRGRPGASSLSRRGARAGAPRTGARSAPPRA